MPELSIIVPVYKVEPYLRRCIDSILAQTFRDFELILIDDGSPDNCGAICDEYAAKDSRIIVIHQKNQGVSAARNAGLDIAKGTYLGFVDSDDWIEPEMYETMIATAKEKQVDVVACSCRMWDENGNTLGVELDKTGEYVGDELLSTIFVPPFNMGHVCWNKLYKTKVIQDCRFIQNVPIGEDGIYTFMCFSLCKSAVKIPSCLYNLFVNTQSVTRQAASISTNAYNILESRSLLLSMTKRHSREIQAKAIDKYMNDCIRYYPLLNENRSVKFRIKYRMLQKIVCAITNKFVPLSKINGYLYEWIRL